MPNVPTSLYVKTAPRTIPVELLGTVIFRPVRSAVPLITGAELLPSFILATVLLPRTVNLSSVMVDMPPVETNWKLDFEPSVSVLLAAIF